MKFSVKFDKSSSETLAILTVAYSEYAVKKSNVYNGIGGEGGARRCAR
jgi:hypothetical protein